jgi:hypothetical protein
VLLTELLFARRAGAEASPRAVRIAYAAAAGCPDRSSFLNKVRARAPGVEVVADETGASDFSVTLVASRGRIVGRLEESRSDGTTTLREVQGDSCETVASAQALATALAIDAASDPLETATASAPKDAVIDPEGSSPPPPVSDRPPTKIAWERDEPAPVRVRWSVGAAAGVVNALPALSAEGTIFADLTRVDRTWPVSVRLFASRVFPRTRGYEWGHASADSVLAGVQFCPTKWNLPRARLGVRPCAQVKLGSLAASGTVTEDGGQSGSDRRLYAESGVGLRAEWNLHPAWQLELTLAALFPMTRYTLTIGDAEPRGGVRVATAVYEIPAVAASAGIGMSMAFP